MRLPGAVSLLRNQVVRLSGFSTPKGNKAKSNAFLNKRPSGSSFIRILLTYFVFHTANEFEDRNHDRQKERQ